MYVYTQNKIITFKVNVIPQLNINISDYEWSVNDLITVTTTNQFNVDTKKLNFGVNNIKVRVKNSCNLWSTTINEQIYVLNPKTMFNFTLNDKETNINVTCT